MQQYRKNLGKVSLTAEGAWNLNNSYDILSIVYDEHTQHGFISRKAVPQGVDLYNKEYWMPLNVSGYADNNVIILSKKTSEANIQSYTLEEAITSIKSVGRRPGAILGFYNENNDRLDIGGRWELWQFNDTNIYNWENVDSWQNLYYNYNKFMGWFKDENFLTKYAPFPEIGCYAFVGSEFNEATVYRCNNKYVWNNTTQHAWDYVKIVVDGNVTVGENGNWFNNGEDTGIPASVKGENGKTPIFREKDNTIQYSFDNVNWITISGKVAAWFRWNATTGDTQANNVGRIQISRDNVTWTNLSGDIINNLHISRYIGTDESLPTSGIAEGTIYAKGPTYADEDTSNANPIYRLWVYAWKGNTLAWQDNGEFTSIAAGIVQEIGDSETKIMSQKAVTEKLSELSSVVGTFNEWGTANYYSEVLVDDDSKILESRDLQGNKTIHTDLEVKGSFKSKELQQLKDDLNEKLEWVESSKFSEVLIDENGKVLESRNVDGTKNINTDINFKDIERLTSVDSMNYIEVLLDKEGKEILAIDKIGNVILNRLVSRCNIIEINNYKGKVLSYLGDSLSSPNNWAKGCENVLNMIIKGSGIGGTSIAGTATTCYHQDLRINALNIDAKVIFIQGGTNDCRLYVKQGEKSKNNYDTTTFWGGFNVMLSKIYYKYLKQSKGFYNNIDYSGVIQVEKPYIKIPIYVILPPTIPVDESDVNNYSDYRDGIALRRQDLIELCELWGLDYVDANQIGYNYMTNESLDVIHGSSNNFFDILGAKVVSKLIEYNSAMTFFDKYAEEMYNIVLVDNSDAAAKVNQTARFNSNVSIIFKSIPNSVSVLSNGVEVPITWVDRITNIACKFTMPNNNVYITIN